MCVNFCILFSVMTVSPPCPPYPVRNKTAKIIEIDLALTELVECRLTLVMGYHIFCYFHSDILLLWQCLTTDFTALHGMQTRSSDEISVRLSVRLSVRPSVCHTRVL